jgi:L-threonate 2-dehydrogenase
MLALFSAPAMFPKAYRFVAEMDEIADFVGEDPAARQMYQGYGQLYQRLAADLEADQRETGALAALLKRSGV